MLREHPSYRYDPVLGEALCKVLDVAEPGDFIPFICGLCGIQWSRGFDSMAYGGSQRGGGIPEGGASVDAVKGIAKFFEKVTGIDFGGLTPGAFCLNANSRCTIREKEFCRCPTAGKGEGKAKADLLNIACTALARLQCVPYFMNLSGSSSRVDQNLFKLLTPKKWYGSAHDQNEADGLPTLDLSPQDFNALAKNSVTMESVHLQFFIVLNRLCFDSHESQKERVGKVIEANDTRLGEILTIVRNLPDCTLAEHCRDPRNGVIFGCDMEHIVKSVRDRRLRWIEEWRRTATPEEIEAWEERRRQSRLRRIEEWRRTATPEEIEAWEERRRQRLQLGYEKGIGEWRRTASEEEIKEAEGLGYEKGILYWLETASNEDINAAHDLAWTNGLGNWVLTAPKDDIKAANQLGFKHGILKWRLSASAEELREASSRGRQNLFEWFSNASPEEIRDARSRGGKTGGKAKINRHTEIFYQAVREILNNTSDITAIFSEVTALDKACESAQHNNSTPHMRAFMSLSGFKDEPVQFWELAVIVPRVQALVESKGRNLEAMQVARLLLEHVTKNKTLLFPRKTLIRELTYLGSGHISQAYQNVEVKVSMRSQSDPETFKKVFGFRQNCYAIEPRTDNDAEEARTQFIRETVLLKYLLLKVIPTGNGKQIGNDLITAVLCRRT